MERKWVIGAFLDISGFRSWTYRAATSPEIKEKFLHQFYAIMEWWVLNWNKPAIDFYTTMGARAMSEWTVYRVNDSQFDHLKIA